jgi:RNA polymerase sigma-70 factor (ECF subfamily)
MLGSVHDAEEALQDALLRAWRGLGRFEGRSQTSSWLYRIATNACLDAIARRPKRRVLPIDYSPSAEAGAGPAAPLPESTWIEPYPDETVGLGDGYAGPEARYERRESIELAFIAALQHLPPRQRAALILREVLGYSAREVAEALELTVASVNSALQRARKSIDERLPDPSQQETRRSLGDERIRELVDQDVRFAMPPYPDWCEGRQAISDSWLMPGGPPAGLRYVPTRANGQPAVAAYRLDTETGRYVPIALDVLTLRDGRITEITAFRNTEIFAAFGLPEALG